MSEKQRKRRFLQELEAGSLQHPDEPEDDVVELAVWICEGCFSGNLRLPLVRSDGKFRDQGIDFFLEDHPVMDRHLCPRSQHQDGEWVQQKLMLPRSMYERIQRECAAEPGERVLDRFD